MQHVVLAIPLLMAVILVKYRDIFKQVFDTVLTIAIHSTSSKDFLKLCWDNSRIMALSVLSDQRGSLGVVAMVMTVIVASIAILIGIIVFANVKASMPMTGLDNQTRQMIDTISQNTQSSFMLLGVGIIVLGAGFILTILLVSLGRAGGE